MECELLYEALRSIHPANRGPHGPDVRICAEAFELWFPRLNRHVRKAELFEYYLYKEPKQMTLD